MQLHKHTNQDFIDKFLELSADLSNRYLNMMIAGDFNIQYFHLENENVDADQFQDMMEAMGLVQHINLVTHTSGNSIDLLFSDQVGQLKIKSVKCC